MKGQHLSPICSALVTASLAAGIALMGGCGGDAPASPMQPAHLTSKGDPPPRPQTKEACDACGGLWGIHGIEPVESCICRTSDGGERCTDGRQCEGQCLVGYDAEFQVMDDSS